MAYRVSDDCAQGGHAGIEIGGGCLDCDCECHGEPDAVDCFRMTIDQTSAFWSSDVRRVQSALDGASRGARDVADQIGREVTILTHGGRGIAVKVVHPRVLPRHGM